MLYVGTASTICYIWSHCNTVKLDIRHNYAQYDPYIWTYIPTLILSKTEFKQRLIGNNSHTKVMNSIKQSICVCVLILVWSLQLEIYVHLLNRVHGHALGVGSRYP